MSVNLLFLGINKFKHHMFVHDLTTSKTYFTGCTVYGIFAHFFILYGFSWMTIIGFDIWTTFRVLQIRKKSLSRLWLVYLPLSILIPLVAVTFGVTFDLLFRFEVIFFSQTNHKFPFHRSLQERLPI